MVEDDGETRERALSALDRAAGAMVQRANRVHLYGEMLRAAGLAVEDALYPVISAVATLGPARVADISSAAGIGPTTGSRHLSQLERLGVVRRTDDPTDARVALVELTPHGRRVAERLRESRRRIFAELVSDWSDAEVERFSRQLQRFVDRIAERRAR
ncbi:MarR family winged helix-turn-helix transcriptional regulator [Streptoalloteichus tenebrarius]|nr:MarR family transcriptional regulator [Streptoalloteichus tenebrarius]BFF01599.1 hypothetical protein GCM10020241_32740 [Streptoalloteichus tenebrarius]